LNAHCIKSCVHIYRRQDRVQLCFLYFTYLLINNVSNSCEAFDLKLFMFAVNFVKTWFSDENITLDIVSLLGYFVKTWLSSVSFIISSSFLLIFLASWFVEFLDIDCSVQLKLLCVFAKPFPCMICLIHQKAFFLLLH